MFAHFPQQGLGQAEPLGRCGAPVVEHEHPHGDPLGIEPVADGVGAQGGDEDEYRVDLFAAADRERQIRPGAGQRCPDRVLVCSPEGVLAPKDELLIAFLSVKALPSHRWSEAAIRRVTVRDMK